MATYIAVCRRSGGLWAISVPKVKGLHTQARRLDQAEDMGRDAIAMILAVDPAGIQVEARPWLPAAGLSP